MRYRTVCALQSLPTKGKRLLCRARLTEDNADLDTMMSHSSRGSRITTNLASFFQSPPVDPEQAEAEERQMAERARQQAAQQAQVAANAGGERERAYYPGQIRYGGYTPPASPNNAAKASAPGAMATEPVSGLMVPATNQLVRVDSDGFEIDDDEDEAPADNRALAHQVVTAISGTPRHESELYEEKSRGSGPHRRTASKGGVVTSMRSSGGGAVAAANNDAHSGGEGSMPQASPAADHYGATPAHDRSGEASSGQRSAAGRAKASAKDSPAAAAARPAPVPARRSTGKTGFIRDWLGSAEPAPGEGPSIALFNSRDGAEDAALRDGLAGATAGYRPRSAAPGLAAIADDQGEEAEDEQYAKKREVERADVVAQLSNSTNTDLRTVLEKARIQSESDHFAAEVEERESLAGRSPGAAAPAGERSGVGSSRGRGAFGATTTALMVSMARLQRQWVRIQGSCRRRRRCRRATWQQVTQCAARHRLLRARQLRDKAARCESWSGRVCAGYTSSRCRNDKVCHMYVLSADRTCVVNSVCSAMS
jgi:hypothetical protein